MNIRDDGSETSVNDSIYIYIDHFISHNHYVLYVESNLDFINFHMFNFISLKKTYISN